MNLFNTYENKNLQFLLNYLTLCDSNEQNTAQEIKDILFGTGKNDKLTGTSVISSILNEVDISETPDGSFTSLNLNLLHDEDGKMQPVIKWNDSLLPERTTTAERAWLKYILEKEESSYFIIPYAKDKILALLNESPLPDISKCIYEAKHRRTFTKKSIIFEEVFKELTKCVFENKAADIHYKKSGVKAYALFCPLNIMFAEDISDFSLLAYNQDSKDIELIELDNIELVEILSSTTNRRSLFDDGPDELKQTIEKCLNNHSVDTPIELEIMNGLDGNEDIKTNNQAYDRCCRLFSGYDTENYDLPNGNTIVNISYYDFQINDIIRKILSLGKYVRVNGPIDIQKQIITILQKKLELYSK